MDLKYRGIPYQLSAPSLEVQVTSEQATFLGGRFARKSYRLTQPQRPSEPKIYRGVHYID